MEIITRACLIAMLLYLQTALLAQDNYIILSVGDTLHGEVEYIDEGPGNREFYKKIRVTTINGKKQRYKRKDVVGFRVNNTNYESFWLNQSSPGFSLIDPRYNLDNRNGEQHFLRVVSKGKLSHYELEWFEQGEATLWSMALLKKANDLYFIRADQGILGLKRKTLADYFFNCLELKEKISKKQINEVWEVVRFYNSKCAL